MVRGGGEMCRRSCTVWQIIRKWEAICHVCWWVLMCWRCKAAMWSPLWQVAETAEGGEPSQFAEVKAIQLALNIVEWEKWPILLPFYWLRVDGNCPVEVAAGSAEVNPPGLLHCFVIAILLFVEYCSLDGEPGWERPSHKCSCATAEHQNNQ